MAAALKENTVKIYIKTEQMGTISYDPNNTPVAIQLDPGDKINIRDMANEANLYCVYPEETDEDEIADWLKTIKD